jgi:uncharacterized DUF497 family protein
LDTARGETRLNVTGWSVRGRILFVVCLEITDDVVRIIISARRATNAEAQAYSES